MDFQQKIMKNACGTKASPYINNCGFNGALAAFQTFNPYLIIPPTNTTFIKENLLNITQFNASSTLENIAYLYVPTACQNGQLCGFHFAFHGCMQSYGDIQDQFITKLGINEIAEANNIIVYYPQVVNSTAYPTGCFDWWGYTDGVASNGTYATKNGKQISAIWDTFLSLWDSTITAASTYFKIGLIVILSLIFI